MKNRYPGKCCSCGTQIDVGAGEAIKDLSGPNGAARWVVLCTSCGAHDTYPDYEPKAAATAKVVDLTGRAVDYVLLSGHPASAHQAAIFEHFKTGRGSRLVNAVAGSGKTTTMKNAVRYLPDSLHVQMLAFNTEAAAQLDKAIAELRELNDGKTYAHVSGGTFHSVGFRAVIKHLGLPRSSVRADMHGKLPKILRERFDATPEGRETRRTYGAFCAKLVALAKGEGIGCLVPDTDERWYDLIDHHALSLDTLDAEVGSAISIARALLDWSNEAAKGGWIDGDDMIYLPILWKLRLWRNHVVIADEAQDTNPVRRAMLHLMLLPGGRLYAVGDRKQSIYGFTGASTDAMDLIAREFNTSELPLTVSYRCPRAVVERAQTWVPYIQEAPGAKEGSVLDDVPLWEALQMLGPTDVVCCRKTAPLVSLAYGLLARGRACQVLGREIGDGLINLIESQRARGIDHLVEKLEAWRDREVAKFTAKGEETAADGVADKADCVFAIIEGLTERTVPGLLRRISGMFVSDKEARAVLTLGTQHKLKGKEYPVVLVLQPELNPSRAARQEWMYEQEINLMYVTATRAKETLIYALPEDTRIDEPRSAT